MRRVLIALDPGSANAGVAVFRDGVLRCASEYSGTDGWLSRAREAVRIVPEAVTPGSSVELVFERPQVYSASGSSGDRNDLIGVALMAGAFARAVDAVCEWNEVPFEIKEYRPAQWKRGVRKPRSKKDPYPIVRRVAERLSESERAVVDGMGWDAHDAVGIGLVHLGRARPGVI